jgi:hypothetical protein
MKQYNLECHEQRALIRWAEIAKAVYPPLALLFAIPNGGFRHITTARNMKAEGAKPGVPDLFLPVARNGYHGLFIEMKRTEARPKRDGSKGGLSDVQIKWKADLEAQGYRVAVCYGFDEARETIECYLNDPPSPGSGRKELGAARNEPDFKAVATHVCQWIEQRTDDVNVEMRDRAEACLRHYLPENT